MTEQSSRPVKERMLADRTGRSNVGRNLLSGWAVELVVIVSGFVTPRLIDTNLGQALYAVSAYGTDLVLV